MNPKKLAEMIAPYRMTHDQNRNPDVFSPSSYELGIKDFMNLPEVKAMREALEVIRDQADFNDNPFASDIAKKALADLEGVVK